MIVTICLEERVLTLKILFKRKLNPILSMKDFSQLKKNLKKDFTNLRCFKVAILGDSVTQFLAQAIRGIGYELGFDLQIFEADFNQIDRQIFDSQSELYDYQPEIVVIFQSSHKLLQKYNYGSYEASTSLASTELDKIKKFNELLQKQLGAKILYYNYSELNDSVFGNFSNKTVSSFLYQLRKLNFSLMEFAAGTDNFHIVDISTIQNKLGKERFFQPSIYVNSDMVLSIDAIAPIASLTVDLINALNGKFKKCVVLDLDNTIWGGVIGDDGIENIQLGQLGIGKAFSEFQHWLKKLKNRGVILAVCSKNSESIAKEPFEKHPDMVLKLEDISVFIANWENKVSNIRQIQSILNIGFDSMIFLDDNPFERNMVRENISEISVPELPEDPADYLEYLYSINLFETVSYSIIDQERTKLYQKDAERKASFQDFSNEDEFLESLKMGSTVLPFTKFNIPRVAELSQRSNQFNLRTIRYTVPEIESIAENDSYFTLTFTLDDKFGENGLIAVLILKKQEQELFIETWLMSCRVLKRGMEQFVLNFIVSLAAKNGFATLVGEYIPTPKNDLVKNHYKSLGFDRTNQNWRLAVASYENKTTYIAQNSK